MCWFTVLVVAIFIAFAIAIVFSLTTGFGRFFVYDFNLLSST